MYIQFSAAAVDRGGALGALPPVPADDATGATLILLVVSELAPAVGAAAGVPCLGSLLIRFGG
jgi:hypothetical protein